MRGHIHSINDYWQCPKLVFSECYLYFDTTDIHTVVNCFTDCNHFVNNTKRSGDIAKYFVDIFRHCTMFDLSMIQG